MINQESILALKAAKWRSGLQRPLYHSYAFSRLPSTLLHLLTGEGKDFLPPSVVGGAYKKQDLVLLVLIDGCGWDLFQTHSPRFPALARYKREGVLSQISAQFPSTTASQLTTLHTGKEVGQTGLYEWFQYEPLIDGMMTPLLTSHAGEHEEGTLVKEGFSPSALFPFSTLYQTLSQRGVRSFVFQQEKIAHSAYSKALLQGAEVVPFGALSEALDVISSHLTRPVSQTTLLVLYYGEIDAVAHRSGLESKALTEAMERCWTSFEEHLFNRLYLLPNKSALLLTSDHGLTPVDPKRTLFVNELLPDLPSHLKRNKRGELLVPAGSCRDFFLHVQEPFLAPVSSQLQEKLSKAAEVLPTSTLIEQGFFGSQKVSERFLERVGNLALLPHRGESLFWRFEQGRFEQHFLAAHGGLSAEEITSPLLFVPLK